MNDTPIIYATFSLNRERAVTGLIHDDWKVNLAFRIRIDLIQEFSDIDINSSVLYSIQLLLETEVDFKYASRVSALAPYQAPITFWLSCLPVVPT